MKTINLGSGITAHVPAAIARDDGSFIEIAVWKDGDSWVADSVDFPSEHVNRFRIRIPVAVLEGRAVPEPAKAEPDWRGFAWLYEHDKSRWAARVEWRGKCLDVDDCGRWVVTPHYFPTRAEAEAALAKAKHPGESA